MLDLFISECRRFARAAATFAAAYMLLLLYGYRINFLPLERDLTEQILMLVAHMAAGIAFAVAQVGSYRQPSRWLWLLHRPLPRLAVFGGLSLSAMAMIVVAIGLPVLLNVLGMAWFTERVVDARYYLYAPYLILVTYIAWLAGVAIILNPSRCAFLIVFIPYVLVLQKATAIASVLAGLATAGLMAAVVYGNFKPDRREAPAGKRATTIAALPLIVGFYFVLQWGGSAIYQLGATAIGMHPLNTGAPPVGGYVETERANGRSLMLMGLANSTDPRAAHWRRQLALTKVEGTYPRVYSYAVPQQLSNKSMIRLTNPQQHVEWAFDHASMRYKGIDTVTGAGRGWSGLGGEGSMQPFPAIPMVFDGYLVTPQLALSVGQTSHTYIKRVQLPAGEVLISQPKKIGERYYVLSDRRLIAYASDTAKPNAPYIEQYSIPLETPVYNMTSVSVAPLLDGTLVSTVSGSGMNRGVDGGAQTVYFVDSDARIQTVARRAIGHDFPQLFEHRAWATSPLIHIANDAVGKAFEASGGKDYSVGESALMPRPAVVWIFALCTMLLSGLAAWLRRRSPWWALTCTALGLPALAAMFVLTTKPSKE